MKVTTVELSIVSASQGVTVLALACEPRALINGKQTSFPCAQDCDLFRVKIAVQGFRDQQMRIIGDRD